MRLFLLIALFIITVPQILQAAVPVRQAMAVPEHLKVANFIKMSVSEFEAASKHKLGITQRMFFRKLQKKLAKSSYSPEATILQHYDATTGKFKLNLLWLILGALIGPFAILFSYTIENKSRNKQLSALIGFGLFILWFGWFFIF